MPNEVSTLFRQSLILSRIIDVITQIKNINTIYSSRKNETSRATTCSGLTARSLSLYPAVASFKNNLATQNGIDVLNSQIKVKTVTLPQQLALVLKQEVNFVVASLNWKLKMELI